VRELIPEFFFQPELLLNLNNIQFGLTQDGTDISTVKLPEWANDDPYRFIATMREAFESTYVSQHLHGWIDFIFGCKQRDQEAARSYNVFH